MKTLRSFLCSLFLAGSLLTTPTFTVPATTAAVAALVTGCAALDPAADPVVVRSQQAISTSFDVVNAFLQYEYANRATVPASVTESADNLRNAYPASHRAALAALTAYKSSKTATDRDALTQSLEVLNALQAIALKAKSEITKK